MNAIDFLDFSNILLNPLSQGITQLDSLINIFQKLDNSLTAHMESISKINSDFIIQDTDSQLYKPLLSIKTYLQNWSSGIGNLLNHLKQDVEEPLITFSEKIKKTQQNLENEVKITTDSMNLCYTKFQDNLEKYYQNSENYEKLSNTETDINKNNKEKTKVLIDEYMNKCFEAENQANEYQEIFENESSKIIKKVWKNEENRVGIIKNHVGNYLCYANFYYNTMKDSIEIMFSSFQEVTCARNKDEYFNRYYEAMPKRIVFEKYEDYKKRMGVFIVQEYDVIKCTLDLLIEQKMSKNANVEKLMKIIDDNDDWKESFVLELESRELSNGIGIVEIGQMAGIFKKIIDKLSYSERNNLILMKVLELAERIYIDYCGNVKYLYEFLIADSNLNEDLRWLNLIETLIQKKLSQKMQTSEKQTSPSLFQLLASKFITSQAIEDDSIARKIAIQVLYDISMKMWKYAIDSEMAKSVIQTFAIKYTIGIYPLIEILSLLHQPSRAHQKKNNQFQTRVFLPFELCMPFLNAKECLSLILLKKSYFGLLKKKYYEKCSIEIFPKSLKTRGELWISALKDYFPSLIYRDVVEDLETIEIPDKYESIIEMDVLRSYHDDSNMKKSLTRILKIYTAFNPFIGYCQGMNFIAGTFLSLFKNEELSFFCLCGFIEKFNMKRFLGEDMKNLLLFFFQLDKLLEIKNPQLYKMLVDIGMFSRNYSSSWFLTVFSSSLQHRIDILYEIWDFFLVKGWKYAFRVALHLLFSNIKSIKNKICEDDIKMLSPENIFCEEVLNNNFARSANKIKVTSHLLEHLEKNFAMILEQANCNPN
ncbi:hypothetical protein SteCoe_3598 [Stentor coeruleus]|uniref:Rab-GAP TBC domain-containing protein n=1 Tax=Stentor coeruleus TaxID=5963 RepID=A0A1R2CWV5_9CILI|nr:hypothetical protein SteCoe_3598 [Stentor coeruleus]